MLMLFAVIVAVFSLGFCTGYGTRALNSQRRRMRSVS